MIVEPEQKKQIGHNVEEMGEPREPIQIGQKYMLNGHLFKVKKIRGKDVVLRLTERLVTK